MKKQPLMWAGIGLLMLSASMSFSQNGPEHVCEVNVSAPNHGAAKLFEEARKTHNKFHVAEKDKTPILVWDLTTGPNSGDYLTVSCGMTWKDMDGHDDFDKRDAADRAKTMAPAVGTNQQSYYIYRGDLSTGKEGENIAKRMTIVHYFLKPSGIVQFTDSVKRINAAIGQTNYPSKPTRWYQLVNGGTGPHYVAVTDRNSWADMQPPEQQMSEMIKQAYGADDKTLQSVRDAVDHTVSEMADYRPDLSYVPAK
jgi:hypothetical protein